MKGKKEARDKSPCQQGCLPCSPLCPWGSGPSLAHHGNITHTEPMATATILDEPVSQPIVGFLFSSTANKSPAQLPMGVRP